MSVEVMGLVWRCDVKGVARFVLLKLADSANDDGSNAWPSVGTLMVAAQASRRSIQRALVELLGVGLIRIARPGGGRNKSTKYSLNLDGIRARAAGRPKAETPEEAEENSVMVTPFLVFEDDGETASPVTETASRVTRNSVTAMTPERPERPRTSSSTPLRGAEEEGEGKIGWSRETLIETAKTCPKGGLNQVNATLLVEGALKTLQPEQVAAVLGEAMGRSRDALKAAMAEAVDQAKRQRSASAEREIGPRKRQIEALAPSARAALVTEINERRKSRGDDPLGSFAATVSRTLAEQVIALGIEIPAETDKKPAVYSRVG